MMKMVPQNHHHRPLSPFDDDSCAGAGDGDGPTSTCSVSMYNIAHHHHHHNINDLVSGASASPAVSAAVIHSGGAAAAVRTLQPFDISTRHPAFKSPGAMAASLGFPFTNAQWKELERQAMIYKYMMASVPVPPNLLIPPALPSASCSPFDNGFNLRLSSSTTDPEPGRCRRTDGKKWRCSRDVAPNHKYCERHMHRGRPRSRKPVEVQTDGTTTTDNNQQNKRPRQDFHHPYPPASAVTVAVSNPTITDGGSSSQFLQSTTSQSFHESYLSFDKYGVKAANFGSLASVPSDSQSRGLDWMLKGDSISMAASDPGWQHLMQAKTDLIKQSPCNNNHATISSYEDALYLSSYASFNSGLDQQNRRCSLFLNPLLPMENPESIKPRGFIDAWSNAEAVENNNGGNASKSPVSSNAKLSLSTLDLSMGGSSVGNEEMGSVHMGLGLMEPDGDTEHGNKTHLSNWRSPAAPWAGSTTPGGPLAEVLRPSAVASAASDPPSPVVTNAESGSPLATMVSSPSGVLQKTLGSMSDCSSNSSPTVASSRANSEFALLLFSKAN